jgi:hypothetical protein
MISLISKCAFVLLLLASSATALTIGPLACCPTTYVFDQDSLTCVCPSNTPHVSANGSCIACNSPATWDSVNQICQACSAGQVQNASGVCVCPKTTPYFNGKICTVCPTNLPVWNGKTCVACPATTFFDINLKTCTICP